MIKLILKEIITDILIFICTIIFVIFLNKIQMIGNTDVDKPIEFEKTASCLGSSSFNKFRIIERE